MLNIVAGAVIVLDSHEVRPGLALRKTRPSSSALSLQVQVWRWVQLAAAGPQPGQLPGQLNEPPQHRARVSCHLRRQVSGLPMLAPFASRLEQLIEQLAACLQALACLVRKEASPDE